MHLKIPFILIVLIGIQALQGCYDTLNCESAKGPIVIEEIDVAPFNGISFDVAGNVYITQDAVQQVVVESNQNVISGLSTSVKDGIWNIRFRECFDRYDKFDVFISLPTLNSVVLAGSGNIISENTFECTDFNASLIGSGNISLQLFCESLDADIAGSGNISLSGRTDREMIIISGSGNIMALEMESNICHATISGFGNCDVFVYDELDVLISGSGSVRYKGNPTVNSTITGNGSVVKIQ